MESFIKIGEFAVGSEGEIFRTVLGSCIGLCLWDPERKIGGLIHIMLPDGREEDKKIEPGKFASTAVDALRDAVLKAGAAHRGLTAKLAGGAGMFFKPTSDAGVFSVGRQNYQKVRERLDKLGIAIAFEHVEGRRGRNISFDCATGLLTVKVQDGSTTTG